MSDARQNLIEDLVADLKPVKRPGQIGMLLALWLGIAGSYSVVILLATGPIRGDALRNLIVHPFFGLETVLAIATIVSLAYSTLSLAIPGDKTLVRAFVWPLIFLTAWLAFYVVGLWAPAHPVSMLGKRDHCVWQTVLFGLPNLLLLLAFTRRLLPVWPRATAMLAGAAAAAIPAALMQFGCMYVPDHILTHHIAPVLVIAGLGAVMGRLALAKRVTVARSRGVSMH